MSIDKKWMDYVDWSEERKYVFRTGELGRQQLQEAMMEYIAEQRRIMINVYSERERSMMYEAYKKKNVNVNTKTL